jgi:hypothetical protein
MRKRMAALLAIFATTLTSNALAQRGPIARLFEPGSLGMSLPYLESQLDAAKFVSRDGSERRYVVQDCVLDVSLNTGGGNPSVRALRLEISADCNPNVAGFMGPDQPALPASRLTFGQFHDWNNQVTTITVDCLYMCGNAYDPVVYLHAEGSRAQGFLEVMIEVPLAGDAAVDAASAWKTHMMAREGEDWVMDARFNCDPAKYRQVALQAFSSMRPTAITIGHGIAPPSGCNQ